MLLEVYSDLHLEFDAQQGRKFMHHMDPTDVDVLILAGDITVCKHLPYVIKTISEKYKDSQVLFVAGNHEHYGSSFEEVDDTLLGLEEDFQNFHWLNYNTFEHKGKVFAGGTLWFSEKPTTIFYKNFLNDFNQIKNFQNNVYVENQKAKEFFANNLPVDVAITHHAPSPQSICYDKLDQFHNDLAEHFYNTDLTHVILERGPKYWFHGHLHEPIDYILGQTRVYSNPKGYPGRESSSYRGRHLLQLD